MVSVNVFLWGRSGAGVPHVRKVLSVALVFGVLVSAVFADNDLLWEEPGYDGMAYNGQRFVSSSGDWLTMELEGYPVAELPSVINKGVRNVIVRHAVPSFKTSSGPNVLRLTGDLTVRICKWDGTGSRVVGTEAVKDFAYGQVRKFPLDLAGLEPGAYLLTAELPPHVFAQHIFNPTNTGTGVFGVQQLYGKNAMRLAVFDDTKPDELFGVGNCMVHCGGGAAWFGHDLGNCLEARDLKPVAVAHGSAFHNAIIGCRYREGNFIDRGGPKDVEGMNNPNKGMLDCYSPAGRAELKRRAEEAGKRLARKPGVYSVYLIGEQVHLNRGSICPTKYADDDFRAFCRARYGNDLAKANRAWNRKLASWDEVRQPIYQEGEMFAETGKVGAAANDWFAGSGRVGKDLVRYLNRPENLELGMDWYRWRAKGVKDVTLDFIRTAHKYDRTTLYGNSYCWPCFFQHLFMPVSRQADTIHLDLQYVCNGLKRTTGNDEQMLDCLEEAESIMKGKPIDGYEIYVQPDYPKEMVALQNWAMIAHGVNVPHVFAWKPYSDHGLKIFKDGPRAWENEKYAKFPMWFLMDTDGTKLPAYEGVKRSSEEIAAFHRKYNGLTLRRTRGRTAIYLSDETSMYIMLKTGDRPYDEKRLCLSRNRIVDRLRLNGARIEFLDDETVGAELRKRDYDAVVLPPTPRMAASSAKALAAFEKEGGKVIRLEDGWEDDFFAKHPEVVRSAWWENTEGEGDVEIVVRTQVKTGRRFVFVLNRHGATNGRLAGPDFKGAKLTDCLTGKAAPLEFALPEYGYRVFEM